MLNRRNLPPWIAALLLPLLSPSHSASASPAGVDEGSATRSDQRFHSDGSPAARAARLREQLAETIAAEPVQYWPNWPNFSNWSNWNNWNNWRNWPNW
jgi:hypothetical protein